MTLRRSVDCFSVSVRETVELKQSARCVTGDCFRNPKGFLNTGRETVTPSTVWLTGPKQWMKPIRDVLGGLAFTLGGLAVASTSSAGTSIINRRVIERRESKQRSREVLGCLTQ